VLKANPISAVGVYLYSGKAIDPKGTKGLDPKKFYGVFRPSYELFDPKTIESINGCRLQKGHFMVGDVGDGVEGVVDGKDNETLGSIYNVKPSKDIEGVLIADIKVYSEQVFKLVKEHIGNLSLGYRCRFIRQEGEYNGKHYDFIQTRLRGNHLAQVKHGRCGSGIRVYDASETNVGDADEGIVYDSLEEIQKMTEEQKKDEPMQVALDSLAEALTGANDELAADVLSFVKNWKPKSVAVGDADEEAKKKAEAEAAAKKAEDEAKAKAEAESAKGASVGDGGEKKPCPKCGKEACDCSETGKTETAVGDEAEQIAKIAAGLAAGDTLAKSCESAVGVFDHSEMDEGQVAHYVCEKMGVAFDSAEMELGYAKAVGAMSAKKEKTIEVNVGDEAEKAARKESARTAACRDAYLGQ